MTIDKAPLSPLPEIPMTTGIGSLPHHNIDAALAHSFQTDIPYLPQIPIRNPWEYMIPQALEGLPGLEVEAGGAVVLDLEVWLGRSHVLNEKLLTAFSNAENPDAFESFEPSAATSSSWQPFLWELEERDSRLAKIQLAGPLTCPWTLRLKEGSELDRYPEISAQILRLIMARAIAMCRRLRSGGIQPILFLDEPGLYCISLQNPRHRMALNELKLVIKTLRNEGAWVGLHCCSNTDWKVVLELGLNVLSMDAQLSLDALLEQKEALTQFIATAGRLSLGVIPTSKSISRDASDLFSLLISKFQNLGKMQFQEIQQILKHALLTPACGLALHSPADAELILASLQEFRSYCALNSHSGSHFEAPVL